MKNTTIQRYPIKPTIGFTGESEPYKRKTPPDDLTLPVAYHMCEKPGNGGVLKKEEWLLYQNNHSSMERMFDFDIEVANVHFHLPSAGESPYRLICK